MKLANLLSAVLLTDNFGKFQKTQLFVYPLGIITPFVKTNFFEISKDDEKK
jgi:hypothetical protein